MPALTIGPELIQVTTQKVGVIQEGMKVAQSHQKSYEVKRWKPLEFKDGDQVFLQVLPTKGVMQFGQLGKFILRYIGPYFITTQVRQVVYRLQLSKEISKVHNAFHVS